MGGFISAPSPRRQEPAPKSVQVDEGELEHRRRLEALARQRRGRAGTIATSPRGLLVLSDWAAQRKSLLGE